MHRRSNEIEASFTGNTSCCDYAILTRYLMSLTICLYVTYSPSLSFNKRQMKEIAENMKDNRRNEILAKFE